MNTPAATTTATGRLEISSEALLNIDAIGISFGGLNPSVKLPGCGGPMPQWRLAKG